VTIRKSRRVLEAFSTALTTASSQLVGEEPTSWITLYVESIISLTLGFLVLENHVSSSMQFAYKKVPQETTMRNSNIDLVLFITTLGIKYALNF
jgi:hypothetical protein